MCQPEVLRSIERLGLPEAGRQWLIQVSTALSAGNYLELDRLLVYAARTMDNEHFKLLAAALRETGAEKWTDLYVHDTPPGYRVFVGNEHPPKYLDVRKGRPLESTDRLSFAADVKNQGSTHGSKEASEQKRRFMDT